MILGQIHQSKTDLISKWGSFWIRAYLHKLEHFTKFALIAQSRPVSANLGEINIPSDDPVA